MIIPALIARTLGIPEARVVPDALLREDLGADLLDLTMLAMALEDDNPGVLIPDDGASWQTVADVRRSVEMVRTPVAGKGGV